MRIRSRLLLISIASGFGFIAPANAADFNITPLDLYPPTVPGVQSGSFNNSFTTGGTFFNDFWTFDVSGPGAEGIASASGLFSDSSLPPKLLGLQLRLLAWDGSNYAMVLSDSGVTAAPVVQADLAPHTGGAPGRGFYAIEVLGNTPPGAFLSTYTGQLQVAAVPEPSTYALLLGGLLLIGWRARASRFDQFGSM